MGDGLGEAVTAGWAVARTAAGVLVTHVWVGVAQAGAWVADACPDAPQDWPDAPQDCVGGLHWEAGCCRVHVGAGVGGGV